MADSGSVNLGFVVEAVEGDALAFRTDVLAVKYAPRSGGLGAQVRKYLKEDVDLLPGVDEYRILPGNQASQAEYVLMVGMFVMVPAYATAALGTFIRSLAPAPDEHLPKH